MKRTTYASHLVGALAIAGALSAAAATGAQELSASRVQEGIDEVGRSQGALSEQVAAQPEDSKKARKANSLLEQADEELAKAKQRLERGELKAAQRRTEKAQGNVNRASKALEEEPERR